MTPASWSLLADYFPENKRALPVSIFLMGPYLGAGLSLILGAEVVGGPVDWALLNCPCRCVGALAAHLHVGGDTGATDGVFVASAAESLPGHSG